MKAFIYRWGGRFWTFLVQLLAADQAPYMLALFIVAAGWTVVRSTDRLSALPLVEYRIEGSGATDRPQRTALRLRNITAASRFGCFALTIAAASGTQFTIDPEKVHSVVIRGAVLVKVSKQVIEPDVARFLVQDLAPGGDVEIGLYSTGVDEPRLLVSSCPNAIKGDPLAEPILVSRSVKSLLLEYETPLLWTGLLIWFILMLVMFGTRKSAAPGWKD